MFHFLTTNLGNGSDLIRQKIKFKFKDSKVFELHKYFITDYASTAITRNKGIFDIAAAFHDWFYRVQPEGVTRKQADGYFLELMHYVCDGLINESLYTIIKAKIHKYYLYLGVRIFGFVAWHKNKEYKLVYGLRGIILSNDEVRQRRLHSRKIWYR